MTDAHMLEDVRGGWAWIALRGLLAMVFGALALIWPGITLAALVLLWGGFALADGLIAAFRIRDRGRPSWALAVVGIAGIAAGVATLLVPGLTALVLLAFIASWALVIGAFQIVAAIRLRKVIEREWIMVLSGVLSMLFGAFVLLRPGEGAIALIWTIGIYAIAFGALLLSLGLRLRGHGERRLSRA